MVSDCIELFETLHLHPESVKSKRIKASGKRNGERLGARGVIMHDLKIHSTLQRKTEHWVSYPSPGAGEEVLAREN